MTHHAMLPHNLAFLAIGRDCCGDRSLIVQHMQQELHAARSSEASQAESYCRKAYRMPLLWEEICAKVT